MLLGFKKWSAKTAQNVAQQIFSREKNISSLIFWLLFATENYPR
jgi:hypothetical protein